MMWNQPKKEICICSSCSRHDICEAHGDVKPDDKIQCIKRSEFDPRHPMHRTLLQDSLMKLLNSVQKSLPTSDIQQFWQNSSQYEFHDIGEHSKLWGNVIFWHKNATIVSQDKFYVPTTAQCIEYINTMKLSLSEVNNIELQHVVKLIINFGLLFRITSSRFGEILYRKQSTNPRRLVKDIMGYGEKMKYLPPQMRWWYNVG